ncbi:MAG: PadR family transcriptional regulator [Firmicutes bacterium]|nr:PadR family transcriptional regulator [Bacillota bacterium]
MDIQLKKGLLEFCILAVLQKEDSYGYQMIKDVSECIEISESTLYPILKRLESSNYLEVYSVEHQGRLRKYYHITEKGKEHIQEFLSGWSQMEKIHEFIGGKQNG